MGRDDGRDKGRFLAMNPTFIFLLTFVFLTFVYGMILILLWKKFQERDLDRLQTMRYLKKVNENFSDELKKKEKQINRLHELYKSEVVEWKRSEIK
jgi:hypothetical protein